MDAAGLGVVAAVFVTSFAVGFSGAAAPGPLLAYSITAAARRGAIAGPLVALGHSLVELVIVIGLAFGLAALAEEQLVRIVIGLAGGVILLVMGAGILRTVPSVRLLPSETGTKHGHASPVLGGAVVSLSNPFFLVWWITVGASLFVWAGTAAGLAGMVAFYFGHIASDFGWYSLVAVVISAGRRFFGDVAYRVLLAICGVFLMAMGVYFTAVAVQSWLG